jgi:hypothetical protein
MMIKAADIVWNQYELNAFRTTSCTFANRVRASALSLARFANVFSDLTKS